MAYGRNPNYGNKYNVEDQVESPDKAWNTGREYLYIHVTLPFLKIQSYRELALWGAEGIDYEHEVSDSRRNSNRIVGLRRYIETLKCICSDTHFIVKKKHIQSGERLNELKEELIKMRNEEINKIFKQTRDCRNGVVKINISEENFIELFDTLEKISEEVRSIINRANILLGEDVTEETWEEIAGALGSE